MPPFEGAGDISTWKLELPKTFSPVRLQTISDVVFHIKYTARDEGGAVRKGRLKICPATPKAFLRQAFSAPATSSVRNAISFSSRWSPSRIISQPKQVMSLAEALEDMDVICHYTVGDMVA
ncbi:MAG: hypothetical protein AABN95_12960 [Acidobacteriota bacterium]